MVIKSPVYHMSLNWYLTRRHGVISKRLCVNIWLCFCSCSISHGLFVATKSIDRLTDQQNWCKPCPSQRRKKYPAISRIIFNIEYEGFKASSTHSVKSSSRDIWALGVPSRSSWNSWLCGVWRSSVSVSLPLPFSFLSWRLFHAGCSKFSSTNTN